MSRIVNEKPQISKLREEIKLLRSFMIGITGKDKEGEYKLEFVKKILKALKEKPKHTFKNREFFLGQIRKRKS